MEDHFVTKKESKTIDHRKCPECQEWHITQDHYQSHILEHMLVQMKRSDSLMCSMLEQILSAINESKATSLWPPQEA